MVGRAGGESAMGSVPKTDARMPAKAISEAVASVGDAGSAGETALAEDLI